MAIHQPEPNLSSPLAELGRFAEPVLLILVSLSDGPKHGWAVMEDIETLTGHRPGPGTLYGALARLEQRGLIERLEAADRRHPYRLTGEGARVLRAELATLDRVVATGLERLATA
jgi:DNA-binding PadR family transcriptional regulator